MLEKYRPFYNTSSILDWSKHLSSTGVFTPDENKSEPKTLHIRIEEEVYEQGSWSHVSHGPDALRR